MSLTSRRMNFRCAQPLLSALLLLGGRNWACAQDSRAHPPEDLDQKIVMDPFDVQVAADRGYSALNSNSITAFNTELKKLPISADILDQTFMDDTGASSVEALITGYSAGAGSSSPNPAATAFSNQPGDRVSAGFLQLRGLTADHPLRDSLLPIGNPTQPGSTGVGFTSNFDVERVEIINGPQALLYGSAGAGGVVNIVSKQARIGQPAFGSFTYQIDQYGGKMGLLDYGASSGNVAVRFSALDQTINTRRINIGGPLHGQYLQIAANVFKNTVIRLEGEQTTYNRLFPINLNLNAGSVAIDSRYGDRLTYLLATNQVNAPASGPNGAGVILNGYLNWSNVASYEGSYSGEETVDTFATLSADTRWNSWLSSKLLVGYSSWDDDAFGNTIAVYSPTAALNPQPGNWTFAQNEPEPEHDTREISRAKTVRYMVMATNELLGSRAHSQSILGFDFIDIDFTNIDTSLVQADANFIPINTPGNTTLRTQGNPGLAPIPSFSWTVNQGPVLYPYFPRNSSHANFGGINYVRVLSNPVNPALISPADPLGVTLGGDAHATSAMFDKGIFGTNQTDWMHGKLTTLVGFRLQHSYYNEFTAGSAPPRPPHTVVEVKGSRINYNLGANYALTNLIRPYFSISSSFDKPTHLVEDPYGHDPQLAHGLGQEVGVKVQNSSGTISGSLALYHVTSKNEQEQISSTLVADINPSGLNGVAGQSSSYVDVNRTSQGAQLTVTAAPSANWRLRLSAAAINGTIGTNANFSQVYNDQFHQNAAGQVTYADGSVVYVPATFNSKTLTSTSGTAGAVPLTVGMLSDPANSYYAAPKPINAQITASSAGGKVLLVTDPVHGAILTGATGLPISSLQVNPAPSGLTVPGTIVVSQAGDATMGYPELSMSLTSLYAFSSGWVKGFEIGGTANLGWFDRAYYYYPNNYTGPASDRVIFRVPTPSSFNVIVGYSHKFKRVTWHTQLNVNNVFNHYSVLLYPGEITGFNQSTSIQASFSQPPRFYQWTNRISF
jgi:outer membrane receptor protein involved in Fe transport